MRRLLYVVAALIAAAVVAVGVRVYVSSNHTASVSTPSSSKDLTQHFMDDFNSARQKNDDSKVEAVISDYKKKATSNSERLVIDKTAGDYESDQARYTTAISDYLAALQLTSDKHDLYVKLATAYEANNDKVNAVKYYKLALDSEPKSPISAADIKYFQNKIAELSK